MYGDDAFFPVIDTPLGRLACMTCFDVYFPEVARILAMRGAEIICMPTGEASSFGPEMELLRRARALENSVYLLCANHGDTIGSPRPINQQWGHSIILDYKGRILTVIPAPGEAVTSALIDVEALRRFKRAPHGGSNLLPQVKSQFYAKFYAKSDLWPLDAHLTTPIQDKSDGVKVLQRVIERTQGGMQKR
jgi:predicted amidohydrolase